jgi:hypothetical protein
MVLCFQRSKNRNYFSLSKLFPFEDLCDLEIYLSMTYYYCADTLIGSLPEIKQRLTEVKPRPFVQGSVPDTNK